jgi:hypothetical protein
LVPEKKGLVQAALGGALLRYAQHERAAGKMNPTERSPAQAGLVLAALSEGILELGLAGKQRCGLGLEERVRDLMVPDGAVLGLAVLEQESEEPVVLVDLSPPSKPVPW